MHSLLDQQGKKLEGWYHQLTFPDMTRMYSPAQKRLHQKHQPPVWPQPFGNDKVQF
nr:hypothetical protein [Jeotgalibacillus soli]